MLPVLDLLPASQNISVLERAVLETLVYSDVFDYPLRLDELHRYLTASTSLYELSECLIQCEKIYFEDGYYFLKSREEIVPLREQRERVSHRAYDRAIRYGRMLGRLPFIRMVALTGSLAVRNCDETGDYDYMLVAKSGRVWMARAFVLLLNRFVKLFNETLCPNLIVSEQALEWNSHDLYSAREICQMIPITGQDVYLRLIAANLWTKSFLPNAHPKISEAFKISEVWKLMELPLRGVIGDKFESWEMTRKIARFSKQAGFGTETVFTADVCQGNFDHHRKWTDNTYQERLAALGITKEERGLQSALHL